MAKEMERALAQVADAAKQAAAAVEFLILWDAEQALALAKDAQRVAGDAERTLRKLAATRR